MKKVFEKVAMALVIAGTLVLANSSSTVVSAAVDGQVGNEVNEVTKAGDPYEAPSLTGNITYGYIFVDSATPNFKCLNGTLTMTLNGEPYAGGKITTIGTHYLSVTGTTENGRTSTINLMFKITGTISPEKSVDDVVNMIKNSSSQEIAINLSGSNVVDKKVFAAIKESNKEVLFTLENITQWVFKGEDIEEDKICDVDLSVEAEPADKEIANAIQSASSDAVFIHFNHHGQLPGKATVKIYTRRYDLVGTEVALYYFNDTNNKIEKVNDNLVINSDSQICFDITHCSDYFTSEDKSIPEGPWIIKTPSVDNNVTIDETEKGSEVLTEDKATTNGSSNTENVKTGDSLYLVLFIALTSSAVCILNRKVKLS